MYLCRCACVTPSSWTLSTTLPAPNKPPPRSTISDTLPNRAQVNQAARLCTKSVSTNSYGRLPKVVASFLWVSVAPSTCTVLAFVVEDDSMFISAHILQPIIMRGLYYLPPSSSSHTFSWTTSRTPSMEGMCSARVGRTPFSDRGLFEHEAPNTVARAMCRQEHDHPLEAPSRQSRKAGLDLEDFRATSLVPLTAIRSNSTSFRGEQMSQQAPSPRLRALTRRSGDPRGQERRWTQERPETARARPRLPSVH